ncbi:MAG: GreA/GreB family elongation factor, partial [Chthoniobacterales bacterium]|nr:GreA/GreB family elongation factor [Chthoniobacterales bacterium]
ELEKNFEDFEKEILEDIEELNAAIEEAAKKARKGQEALAIVMLLVRDEILHILEPRLEGREVKKTFHAYEFLTKNPTKVEKFFDEIAASWHKALLEQFEEAYGEGWVEKILELLRKANPRLAATIYNLFHEREMENVINAHIFRWIAERSAPSDLLYWICKRRHHECAVFFTPSLFNAIMTAMELDQLNEKRRGRKLASLLLQDRNLLQDMFGEEEMTGGGVRGGRKGKGSKSKKLEELEVGNEDTKGGVLVRTSFDAERKAENLRDAFRRLKASSVFDDLEKRTLLGRLLKIDPTLEQILTTTQERVDDVLTVSWASLERLKAELDDIVNRLIPHNTREIQKAKEYGDLRENFEYKSAKEQQVLLTKRQAELETTIARAQGTNFENPDTSRVSIGTTITLSDVSSGAQQVYSILGAWDSAPEEGIISYRAALGQSLLGKEPGDEVPLADGRILRIDRIEPFRNHEILKKIHQYRPPVISGAKN